LEDHLVERFPSTAFAPLKVVPGSVEDTVTILFSAKLEETVTVTANVLAALDPHVLFAVTEIVPLAPAVVVIDAEVEVPDQPDGKVHV
jgi:hypothetical protein